MAERTISTIIRLDNDAAYKAALKGCNAELKNLKSQLDLTSSEFRNNANSMDALTAKGTLLEKMYAAQQKTLDTLNGAREKAQETQADEKRKISELEAQYASAKQALDAYGNEIDESNKGYQTAKERVEKLTNSIEFHKSNLATAEKAEQRYTTQINRATIELHNLKDQQDENNRLLEEAKASADGCATSIDKYGDAVKNAGDGTEKSASAVEVLSAAMVAGGIQQKVEDLATAMMECAEASQTFELAIAKVYTLADDSVLSQEAMRAGILEMSSELGKSADEIGEAVYEALSAGVETANVLSFVREATQLSVAGFTDAANSVDVLTTILNAYGLEASQTEAIASKLVKTQDLGKITVDDLGSVLGRIIPTAAAYGVNLDNIAAAYADMTASGINAENTTTYLSAMLDELANSGSDVAEVLKEKTGQSFAELMASGRSLGDVLDILGESVGGDTVQFSNLWSSATAGKAAIALFNSGAEKFNSTLSAMANSSGAVAANYTALASTSEFASNRIEVAAENLKIAVGDQLNPVLDKLRNGAADIMEAAADIISNNPALVATITGVVTVVGLLAAGLSALMIAKSAAAAMEALNIALTANPAGLVAMAVAALGVTIATLVAQSDEANSKLEDLTASSRAFADTVAAGNQSYADSVASAEAAYATVDAYIDQLAELEAQGVKTEEQQAKYALILDQINAVMPELNASIDAQTNLVEGGTAALRAQAEQLKQNIIQEAVYARYADDVAALADAQYELMLNEIQRSNAEKQLSAASEKLAENQEQLAYWTNEFNNLKMRDGETLDQYRARVASVTEKVNEYSAAVQEQAMAQREAEGAIAEYDAAIESCNDIIAEQTPLVEAATEAYNSYSEQVKETSEVVADESEAMAERTSASLDRTSEEYLSLYASARQSLDSQIGLFEKVSVKSKQSTADMIAALQSQKKAFDEYATNISLAMERGIDVGLVQQLSDGSTESMAILAKLVSATDEEIASLNEAFSGVGESKDMVSGVMADVKQIVTGTLDDTAGSAYDAAYSVGANIGDGAIAGLNSRKSAYVDATSNFVNAGFNKAKSVEMINSPSKRWTWLGEMEAAGPITGLKKEIPKMEAASAEFTNAGYAAAVRKSQQSMTTMVKLSSQPAISSGTNALPVLTEILAAIKAGQVISLDGRVLVGATGKQRDQYMGQQKFLAERGAK